MMTGELRESNESLWWLAGSPTIWAAHFLLSYVTAAVWCAKAASPDDPIGVVRIAIVVYTIAALAGTLVIGWHGTRRARFGASDSRELDTPADRHRFMGFATLLLSGLSAVAIVYATLPVFFLGSCR
jgi:hypothetical protein